MFVGTLPNELRKVSHFVVPLSHGLGQSLGGCQVRVLLIPCLALRRGKKRGLIVLKSSQRRPEMPYCPICKAEYCTGFARCCHCLALLVGSSSEADAARVVLLWEGLSRHRFEAIVAALRTANIPNRAGCGADTGTAYISRGRQLLKGMKKTSWQVSVLEADYERAQNVARSCL